MTSGATFCQVANGISWSSKDTDQTIREIKGHNAVYDELCKTKTP